MYICNRFYSMEEKKALDFPDWLYPTCTYRLFLIFNQLLSDEMTITITGTTTTHHYTLCSVTDFVIVFVVHMVSVHCCHDYWLAIYYHVHAYEF